MPNVQGKTKLNSAQLDTCPDCGSTEFIFDSQRGEEICSSCGLVLHDHIIDHERERRAFTQDERRKRERTGSPISVLLPDMGLSTVIDRNTKGVSAPMKRAIKWNTRMSWSKRNLLIATTEIKRLGSNLGLPIRVKELAATVYKQAFKLKLLRGRSIRSMVAAAIYYACRKEQVPRTLQEVIDETNLEAKEVRRCYRTLLRELKLKVPSLDPRLLIPKFISALNLSAEVEKEAIRLLNTYVKNNRIGGKDPKGICAAAVYVAAQRKDEVRSQSKIAATVGVTEVTLRSRYKELVKTLELE
ncbi:MAG: transcription initiation factor IIB [Promethearchaeota archaeon]